MKFKKITNVPGLHHPIASDLSICLHDQHEAVHKIRQMMSKDSEILKYVPKPVGKK